MLPLPRILARDRRRAAIHEAGHVVIARYLGLHVCRADIWPVEDIADPYAEKMWLGQVQTIGANHLRGTARRMIGLAGAMAEAAWFGDIDEVDPWLGLEAVSPTDWKMAELDPDQGLDSRGHVALDRLVMLLRRGGQLWGDLVSEANALIQPWRDDEQFPEVV